MLKPLFLFLCAFLLIGYCLRAQQTDSLQQDMNNSLADTIQADSGKAINKWQPAPEKKANDLNRILKDNIFLNAAAQPVSQIQASRKYRSKDVVFYVLCTLLLFLGILKVSYARYFSNLVRVFFNTSLRQGQLTDQLLQAKLPSLFFNIFFVMIGGWYLYLLLNHFQKISYNHWNVLSVCIALVLFIYVVKFCTLKFAGWLTGYKQEAETYIFIVFLINKIIAICLVPVVVVMPFSKAGLVHVTVIISFIMIGLMFLMRFFRSYGLLQNRLKVNGFHFLLYIFGVEVLPLLLIYKGALVIMSKNL